MVGTLNPEPQTPSPILVDPRHERQEDAQIFIAGIFSLYAGARESEVESLLPFFRVLIM